MKENHLKRLLSFVLVIAMVVSLCPTIAFAGDTLPYQGESALADNEPTSHGYRAEDLLSWDPATDPDAELLRARVPLQNRIEAVAATQANPSLNPEVEYLTLAGDYGNAFLAAPRTPTSSANTASTSGSTSTTTPPGTARLRLPHPLSCGMRKASGRVPTIGKDGSLSSA